MGEYQQPIEGNEGFRHCFETTTVNYSKRKIYHPKLKSFNDLETEKSALVRNPLVRIANFFLDLYWAIVGMLSAILHWLYPKKPVIHCRDKNSQLMGRLLFGQKTFDMDVPIHHMHVEFWGRTWLGSYRCFGSSTSDENGYFQIPFDLYECHKWYLGRFRLEIYHTGYHKYIDQKATNDYILFHKTKVKKQDLIGLELDMGNINLFYWEYDYTNPLARVIIKDHNKDAPESYPSGRLKSIEHQFIPIEIIKDKHLAEIKLMRNKIDLEEIQNDYPINLTQCLEKKQLGITRSDEWFGERFMNGMFAIDFDKDPKDPNLYWTHYHWNSYDKTTNYIMPDVDIKFGLNTKGFAMPLEISLTGALHKNELGKTPKRTFTPKDGSQWMAAKRIARVSAALYTEIVHHLCITHYNTEQFSIAAHRNLHLSALTNLLFPHLKSVTLVNHTSDRILTGDGYISEATALTPKGMGELTLQTMGTQDWKNWIPIKPISDQHTYAHISNLFWDVVCQYVDEFIDENKENILENWFEVYRFSNDLVEHSAPYFLCNYLTKMILDDKGEYDAKKASWYQTSRRMDQSIKRPMVNGELKSMSKITTTPDPKKVTSDDINNLKQACSFMIYHASFGHTWSNSKQYDDIGEVLYCSLGLRFGSTEEGALGPESDLEIAPDLKRSTQMMWWSNMLSKTGYGYITKNEDQDINPRFIALLEAKRKAFKTLGFDIDTIQSRTNI